MRFLTISAKSLVIAMVWITIDIGIAQETTSATSDTQRVENTESVVEERSRELVTSAILQLYQVGTVDALFQIRTGGEISLAGEGGYQAVWDERGLRFRYLMRFPLSGETTAVWLQCCDGMTLQTLTDIHGPTLRRVQLGQIRHQLELERREIDARWPGMGGIPKLLWQIGRTTTWRSCELVDRSIPEPSGKAWKLVGTLRDDAVQRYFASYMESNEGGADGVSKTTKEAENIESIGTVGNTVDLENNTNSENRVGDNNSEKSESTENTGIVERSETMDRTTRAAIRYLPDQIVLYLDQETLFLCGVEFFHTDERGHATPIVSLVVTRFSLGGEIDEKIFAAVPEGIEAINVTHSYLEALRNGTF